MSGLRPTGLSANIHVDDMAAARDFYGGYLGLSDATLDLGWVVRLETPDRRVQLQLVTGDASAPVTSAMSVHVGDRVEAAYAEAQRRGFEIVYPLTTEPWGVRRFFVRAPDGTVINVVSHSDD